VQYYIFALVFLIFDVETVFLYPWAAAFDSLPLFAVVEGVIFILILVAGLIYAWRKGVLEWF
jgi:NADH-quinone oxidoreductase subunit A